VTSTSTSAPMVVLNGDPGTTESVASILYRWFGDFEFFVVDDGSTEQILLPIATASVVACRK
jgi:hypothetical protein